MKWYKKVHKDVFSIALSSAAVIILLSVFSTFSIAVVSASGKVTPTDAASQTISDNAADENAKGADQTAKTDDVQGAKSDDKQTGSDSTRARATRTGDVQTAFANAPDGKNAKAKTVTVTRDAPDLLLSNNTGVRKKNGSKFNRFLPSAGYNGSYRSELDDNEKKTFDALYQALVVQRKNYTEKIRANYDPTIPFDVVYSNPETGTLSIDDLGDIDDMILSAAAAFFYDCPEAYWVRSFSYTIDADLESGKSQKKGYVDWIEFQFTTAAYPNAYNELAAYDAGVSAAVNSIKQSRKNESVYETVKAIHDYILLNASYEYSALSGSTYTYGYAYTATPLFTGKGKFVCEGYSKAMKILCGKFGINCALVSGDGMTSDSSGGPHMWNYVQIGGKWYAVDNTWDDGYTNQDGTPSLVYNYFLVGSTTYVRNNKMFSQDHINNGQVMSSPTKFDMVFPTLSQSAYERYIVDTNPKITLTTLGASIRVSEPYGIRFGIQIKRDDALRSVHLIPEFGTLIIPTNTLGDNELTINTPNVRKIKADNIYSQDETQYTYTGVLIKIPKSFFGTNIKGRGYLIYIDNDTGEEHIIYSKTVEKSFYGVAQAAYDQYSKIQNPTESQKAILKKLEGFLNN